MLRPTPPATIWATRTAPRGASENSSTIAWRLAAGTDPVSGPNTLPGRIRATSSRASRKWEKTSTLRWFSSASSTMSSSLRIFSDLRPARIAAWRIAMKFDSATDAQ